MIKIAGLYEKTREDGKKYYSGKLGYGVRLVMYPNKYKKKDTHPDYNLFISEIKQQQEELPAHVDENVDEELPFE